MDIRYLGPIYFLPSANNRFYFKIDNVGPDVSFTCSCMSHGIDACTTYCASAYFKAHIVFATWPSGIQVLCIMSYGRFRAKHLQDQRACDF